VSAALAGHPPIVTSAARLRPLPGLAGCKTICRDLRGQAPLGVVRRGRDAGGQLRVRQDGMMAHESGDDASATPERLAPDRLRRAAGIDSAAVAGMRPVEAPAAYPRAAEAIRFGAATAARGFNIVAIGSPGAQIREAATSLLAEATRQRPPPADWVYVNNFKTPHRPIALSLPRGRAPLLRRAMNGLVDDLRAALPAMFESDDYVRRRGAVQDAFNAKASAAFDALGEKAAARGLTIVRTPMGFAVAPAKDGKVVPPEEFAGWPEER
jgi:hypothetical protein